MSSPGDQPEDDNLRVAEAFEELKAMLRAPIAEANGKLGHMQAFLQTSYSGPFAATVALVAALKNMEEAVSARGIDGASISA